MENYLVNIDKQFETIIVSDNRKIIDAFIIKYESILHSFNQKQVVLNKTETKLFYQDQREEYRLHFKKVENGYIKSQHSLFEKCIELITKLLDEAKEKQASLPLEPSNTHFECVCGSNVLIKNKARHLKSLEHLNSKTNEKKEQHYNCNCGSKVLITNKSRHLKSKGHNTIKKEEAKKKEPKKEESKKEEPNKEEKDYICGCGKRVLKSNKFNHNNTSFHEDWANQFIDEYTST
jgi:DNA-directed RNA polymerase subunit RPC12/RpoP